MIRVKGGVQVSVGFVVVCEGVDEKTCTPTCTTITISGNKHLIPSTETSITINVIGSNASVVDVSNIKLTN